MKPLASELEFRAEPGERSVPIGLVALEVLARRKLALWADAPHDLTAAPYNAGPDSLVVAYYASAEMGCHLALGWESPANLLEWYAEFLNLTNGQGSVCGNGLLGDLADFGLPAMDTTEKESGRALAMRGGPYSAEVVPQVIEIPIGTQGGPVRMLPAMFNRRGA